MGKYLSIYDVAARFSVNVSTIYAWLNRGWMIPPRKLGRRTMWTETEIDAWEAAGFPRPCDQQKEVENVVRGTA